MSSSVIIKFKDEDREKVSKIIEQIGDEAEPKKFNYRYVKGPDLDGYQINCFIEWNTWILDKEDKEEVVEEVLQISYNAGIFLSDLANAIALEICKLVKPENAGWEEIGYCKDVNEFLNVVPFKLELDNQIKILQEKVIKRIKVFCKELKKPFNKARHIKETKEEIENIKRYKKIVDKFVEEMFKNINDN